MTRKKPKRRKAPAKKRTPARRSTPKRKAPRRKAAPRKAPRRTAPRKTMSARRQAATRAPTAKVCKPGYLLTILDIPGPSTTHAKAQVVQIHDTRDGAQRALRREQQNTIGMDSYGLAWAVVESPKNSVCVGDTISVNVSGKEVRRLSLDDDGNLRVEGYPLQNPEGSLSTGAMIGLGVLGAALVGGLIYYLTKKPAAATPTA